MNMKNRLILQFISLLLVASLISIGLVTVAFSFMRSKINELEMNRDFTRAGLSNLVTTLRLENGNIIFDPDMLALVKRTGGWLQTIDENGVVTSSYLTPPNVPTHYKPGEIHAIWSGEKQFPYSLYIWIEPKDGITYTLLYGVKYREAELIKQISTAATLQSDRLAIPPSLEQEIIQRNMWVQILDANGTEIASLSKPPNALNHYSVQELTLRVQYPARYQEHLFTTYDDKTEQTWILHVPTTASGEPTSLISLSSEDQIAGVTIIVLLIAIITLFLLLSLWYGHRFGTPMLHLLEWLKQIAKGTWEEPQDRNGLPKSLTKSGSYKRNYRIYQEVMLSMHHLVECLQRNNEIRNQLEKTREEWIAGVSHDLKTPLSSILGYSKMLENTTYEWTPEEIQDFGSIMSEKSAYMDALINDLSMTYRLKNGAYSLTFTSQDINELVRRSIISFLNHPPFQEAALTFQPALKTIHYPVDSYAFQRMVDNVIANAILHNPVGTPIEICLSACETDGLDAEGFALTIRDCGTGMEPEVTQQLFERYYRGTNTEGLAQGTGLGMAIAKELALAHGGEIQVASELGQGTTIQFTFHKEKSLFPSYHLKSLSTHSN
ncbi:sensor histidine kinase [Brevibacillus laterosporus]|uniref:histidine kinase n=1 Tax=Brevibacillus laterosporus TaxID=1465 RepID=A0AAP3DFQ4_BRELA|nr:HAMP domain-containing sensor histidine kinase [Brevibacillus laterosporus]MCR8979871.1 HAMP domain-containing histidine kinase [Brevibacillus laterosporus]MCZ0807026.1 HAMP domain-containing sensor histidine kinase [Brevibacillus laterosporus]MCZ0827915.1 HAMP domain-containing sensor histidine kinase [Brevibacillus laterosporus]MCZ0851912.1 HAMP domain-containing sensor histidine kinase [Brevibacillus laterosporus]